VNLLPGRRRVSFFYALFFLVTDGFQVNDVPVADVEAAIN